MASADFSNRGQPHLFDVERAVVRQVLGESIWPDHYIPEVYVGTQRLELEILTGDFSGEVLEAENLLSRFHSYPAAMGDQILVSVLPDASHVAMYNIGVYGVHRFPVIAFALVLLAIAMVAIGRKKGLYAMVSLAFTLTIVVFLLVNGIVAGGSPIWLGLLTAFLTTTFSLLMVCGAGKQALSSIVGTVIGLFFAGVFSLVFSNLGSVSGIHLDGARQILYHSPEDTTVLISQLFFAAVIISASGACVDASISVSSTVFEMKSRQPDTTEKSLFKSAMIIGSDVLGANANTLILALTGASLPIMVLIGLFGFPALRLLNLDVIAIEGISAVSAAMGMIASVPATAFFSARLAK